MAQPDARQPAAPVFCKICDDHPVTRHKRLGVCTSCYSGISYWRGRSVGDLIKHDAKLARLKKRTAFMMGVRTNQVVTPLPEGRRRRAG